MLHNINKIYNKFILSANRLVEPGYQLTRVYQVVNKWTT